MLSSLVCTRIPSGGDLCNSPISFIRRRIAAGETDCILNEHMCNLFQQALPTIVIEVVDFVKEDKGMRRWWLECKNNALYAVIKHHVRAMRQ